MLTPLYLSTSPLPIIHDPQGFSFGGLITTERTTGQLYMSTRHGRLVPLTRSGNTFVVDGPMIDPPTLPSSEFSFTGALIDGNRVIRSASIFYDANNTQRVGHFIDGRWRTVNSDIQQGFVAGYMAWIPPDNNLFGVGDFLTGQSGIPIIHRTSYGPAVSAVHLANLRGSDPIPAAELIYYSAIHATLGEYEGEGHAFNETMQIKGVAVIDDDIVFAGTLGIGSRCYGVGTNDPSKHDLTFTDEHGSNHFCYDPELSDKGGHAYPYRYQLWVYPIADVLAAAHPWDLIPTIIPLTEGFLPGKTRLAGMAYDPFTRTIYFSQYDAENSARVGGYPVLIAYRAASVTVPPPEPVEPPVIVIPPTPALDHEARITRLERLFNPEVLR